MALSDQDKDILKIPVVTVAFLEVLSKTAGVESLHAAAEAIQLIPVEQIAEALAALRTDDVFIDAGSMEIMDGVEIEIFDDEGE